MMKQVDPKTLFSLINEVLTRESSYYHIHGIQPFRMSIYGKEFDVFVKNITSAYFADRPDTSRAQLAIREIFADSVDSNIPFVFLGYDGENDVFVCWNPINVKDRLNGKTSVSFYSRFSSQRDVANGLFSRLRLKNDDNPVLFKRDMLVEFFERIDEFFPCAIGENVEAKNNGGKESSKDKMIIIEDESFKKSLLDIVNKGHSLQAMQLLGERYGAQYPQMTLRDWSSLLNTLSEEATDTKDIPVQIIAASPTDKDCQELFDSFCNLDNFEPYLNYLLKQGKGIKTCKNYVYVLKQCIIRGHFTSHKDLFIKCTTILAYKRVVDAFLAYPEMVELDERWHGAIKSSLAYYIPFVDSLISAKSKKSVRHSIKEDFTGKTPVSFSFIDGNTPVAFYVTSWRDVLINVCKYCYDNYRDKLIYCAQNNVITNSRGTNLLPPDSKRLHSFYRIADSMYIETNRSANVLMGMVSQILKAVGISIEDFRIEL